MRRRKELYLGLIAVLYHQLGEIPPDFFVDIVSQNNFLTTTLQVEEQPFLAASLFKPSLCIHTNRQIIELFRLRTRVLS